MEELKHPWMTGSATPAEVLVINFDSQRIGDYQRVARALRADGIGVEVYPEVKKPKSQFEYADKKGFKAAVIAGGDEFGRGVWKVKDLAKREETEVTEGELVAKVRSVVR
jgi:histidyl-tRNA synthetase